MVAANAQGTSVSNSVPIAWTDYHVSSQNISIQLPKLPTMRSLSNACTQVEGASYYAYADGVGYEFAWRAKSTDPIPDWCDKKEKFSKNGFTSRIDELKEQNFAVEPDTTIAGLSAKVLRTTTGDPKTRWLIWDKDRWFELGITSRTGNVGEAKFTSGLNLTSSKGQEIGDGADIVYGDPDDVITVYPPRLADPLVIVTKPRARFTDAARQSNFQGTVMLRVVFQKNGAIGDVSIIKDAPYGLGNEAMKAARRIGFLPAVVNATPVTVTKSVEYSFTLY